MARKKESPELRDLGIEDLDRFIDNLEMETSLVEFYNKKETILALLKKLKEVM